VLDLLQRGATSPLIVKPDMGSQGQGIVIAETAEILERWREPAVAQAYITPFSIDNLKFDLRIYVLMASVDPLRLYVLREGMARFCTKEYTAPRGESAHDVFRHLTNFSVNKKSADYREGASKRSLTSILGKIVTGGGNRAELLRQIDRVLVLTVMSIGPLLTHNYRAAFRQVSRPRCFEILGFDVLIDRDLKPWVLEVNLAPSFACSSAFDSVIKEDVITGALRVVGVPTDFDEEVQRRQRVLARKRIGDRDEFVDAEAYDVAAELARARRTEYRLIYPSPDPVLQAEFDEAAAVVATLPILGTEDTEGTSQRRRACEDLRRGLDGRDMQPRKYRRIVVATCQPRERPAADGGLRETRSTVLLRQARSAQIKRFLETEPQFLSSPRGGPKAHTEKVGRERCAAPPT
jgi:tubulin polyglutamylase TTLL6/13